jgi:hypothetical protein
MFGLAVIWIREHDRCLVKSNHYKSSSNVFGVQEYELSVWVTEFIQQNLKCRIFLYILSGPRSSEMDSFCLIRQYKHRKLWFIQRLQNCLQTVYYHTLIHKKTRLTSQTYLCFVIVYVPHSMYKFWSILRSLTELDRISSTNGKRLCTEHMTP